MWPMIDFVFFSESVAFDRQKVFPPLAVQNACHAKCSANKSAMLNVKKIAFMLVEGRAQANASCLNEI